MQQSKRGRTGQRKKSMHSQSALEYVMTYSWAILIAIIVVALLYFFVLAPQNVVPQQCTFANGAYCRSVFFGSDPTGQHATIIGVYLTNTQDYPVVNPSLKINVSGTAVTANCNPTYPANLLVLPGGAVICYANFPESGIQLGTLEAARLNFAAIPCQSGNADQCSATAPVQTYVGSFTAHVSQAENELPVGINLLVLNATTNTLIADGTKDKMNATVTMYGYPLLGATVQFTSNVPFTNIYPTASTSDSNGNATSYVSSLTPGNAMLTANFIGYTANVVISFLPAVYVTYQINGQACSGNPGATALTVDGNIIKCAMMPNTLIYAQGSRHNYAFASPLTGASGSRYAFQLVNGCGASAASGTLTAYSTCNVVASYTSQYQLLMSVPSGGGTAVANPGGGWYASGTPVQITASPTNNNWNFDHWQGAGTISYSGTSSTNQIIMDGPITENAYFYQAMSGLVLSSSPSEIDIGQGTTLTANWGGGLAPYTANFFYGQCSSGTLMGTNTPMAATASAANSPTSTGQIPYCVNVVDAELTPASLTASTTVKVNPLPTVLLQVSPSSMESGQTAVFTAIPSGGTGTDTYNWGLPSGVISSNGDCISTTSTCTISPAPSVQTVYTVNVAITDSAPITQMTSPTASNSVTVYPTLSVLLQPQNPVIDSGQQQQMQAVVTGGSSPYSYQWYSGLCSSGTAVGTGSSSYTAGPLFALGPYRAGVVVPLYVDPSSNAWTSVIAAKNAHPSVPIVVIANPVSGPGSSSQGSYVTGIRNMQAAGVIVIGYVFVNGGTKSVAAVESEVDKYNSWYGVNGIFFDGMTNTQSPGNENYYTTITNYERSQYGGTMVMGDPGDDVYPSYAGIMDNLMIYEDSGLPQISYLGGWHAFYNKYAFSYVSYSTSSLDTSFEKNSSQYAGYLYITNDNLPNPYDTLPPYFSTLVATLDNSGSALQYPYCANDVDSLGVPARALTPSRSTLRCSRTRRTLMARRYLREAAWSCTGTRATARRRIRTAGIPGHAAGQTRSCFLPDIPGPGPFHPGCVLLLLQSH